MSANTPTASDTQSGPGRRWLPWSLAGLAFLVGWVILALWTPSSDVDGTICLLRRTTGLACPGCGMTRAMSRLARGELPAAVELHPLAPLLLVEALGAWLAWGVAVVRNRPFWRGSWVVWVVGGNYALLLVVWIARWSQGTLPP